LYVLIGVHWASSTTVPPLGPAPSEALASEPKVDVAVASGPLLIGPAPSLMTCHPAKTLPALVGALTGKRFVWPQVTPVSPVIADGVPPLVL